MENFSSVEFILITVVILILLTSSILSKLRMLMFCLKNRIDIKKEKLRAKKLFPLDRIYTEYSFIGISSKKILSECCGSRYIEIAGKVRGVDDTGFGYRNALKMCSSCHEITKF